MVHEEKGRREETVLIFSIGIPQDAVSMDVLRFGMYSVGIVVWDFVALLVGWRMSIELRDRPANYCIRRRF